MLTYSVWSEIVNEYELDCYTTTFEKMAWYSFGVFLTPFAIVLDIVTLPFQLIGILIYFVTQRRKR